MKYVLERHGKMQLGFHCAIIYGGKSTHAMHTSYVCMLEGRGESGRGHIALFDRIFLTCYLSVPESLQPYANYLRITP